MMDKPEWIANAESECMRNWTDNLHNEAKRLMIQDGTHVSLLFLFNKTDGLVSVNQVPPNVDHSQLNEAIANAVNEHNLYGVVFIGETWTYFVKENDHTAFQLLDGEMSVSDLNPEDKREALMIKMENEDGDCVVYLDEIIRNKDSVTLKECLSSENSRRKWFVHQEDMLK